MYISLKAADGRILNNYGSEVVYEIQYKKYIFNNPYIVSVERQIEWIDKCRPSIKCLN